MPLNKFNPKYQGVQTKSTSKQEQKFHQLMDALEEQEIPKSVVNLINEEVDKVNQADSKKLLTAQLAKSFRTILKIAEKEMNLVAKNHYKNMWLAIGMSAFGIPLGIAFGASLNNYGLMAVGIPIGFAIGIAIGSKKDKEAEEQGKQLDIEI
ncbi:hypothetical protein [Marivirga harenae]|uniref:hypothetical protein n=1 Tax=Marivirga harenae TaxID=2010992 RepID=UPI0026DED451|nr:hypothetical protein [Marivirga harenae]WKV13846.1 hypothetical protein Q3Y49_08395 [Marivirga harenae]